MTAFTQKTFTVGATSPDAQKKYSEGWDRIFRPRPEPEETVTDSDQGDKADPKK